MRIEFNYDPKRKEVKLVTELFSSIREHFSVRNPGANFNRNNRFIPQRIYAITPAGYFGIGLIADIVKYVKSLNIPYELIFNAELIQQFNKIPICKDTDKIKKLECEYTLREYQLEAVEQALNRGSGIIELATGGGKTFIISNLVYAALQHIEYTEKVLIIVPDLGLVEQTYKDFTSYNFPMKLVTKWTGSNELDPHCRVIIANLGILQSEKSDISWFTDVGLLIVDECHKLRKGNKVNKLIDRIPTLRRFGFTGTLPESEIDKWNIYNYIGPVIYKKTTTELREIAGDKYIANAQAVAIKLQYTYIPDYTSVAAMQKYRLELDFIHNSTFRNNVIKNVVSKLNQNCLILADHIQHGQNMYNTISTLSDKQVYFIQGSVEVEDRIKIQQLMEKDNNVVCIAISKIFSTGISIKNIHYIMFAAGGKSKIKTLQSIGRGLRTHENKNILTLIDIVDDLIYGVAHYQKRKNFYDLEKIKITEKNITETTR